MTDPIIPPYPADARSTRSTVAPSDDAAEVVAESLPFVVEAPVPNAPLPGIAPAMRRVDGGYVREDAHPGAGEPDWRAEAERVAADLAARPKCGDRICQTCLAGKSQSCFPDYDFARLAAAHGYVKAPDPDSLRAEAERLLPCGHPESLALRSVESSTVVCELCEARSAARDAEKMEASLREELTAAREDLEEMEQDDAAADKALIAAGASGPTSLAQRIKAIAAERDSLRAEAERLKAASSPPADRHQQVSANTGESAEDGPKTGPLSTSASPTERVKALESERDSLRAEVARVHAARDAAAGGPECRLPTWAEVTEARARAEKLWRAAWDARAALTVAKDQARAIFLLSKAIEATTECHPASPEKYSNAENARKPADGKEIQATAVAEEPTKGPENIPAPASTGTGGEEAHACIVCPPEVRNLFALASSVTVWDPRKHPDRIDRFYRKLDGLIEWLAKMEPLVEAHFAAIDATRKGGGISQPPAPPATAGAPCGGTRCYQSADGDWVHSSKSYGSCSVRRARVTP